MRKQRENGGNGVFFLLHRRDFWYIIKTCCPVCGYHRQDGTADRVSGKGTGARTEGADIMKLAFIGCGAMGGALVSGTVAKGAADGGDVFVFDMDDGKTAALADKYGVNVCGSEEEAAGKADIIFVCVKPAVTGAVSKKIKDAVRESKGGKAVVSVAAGVTATSYLDILGRDTKLVRLIPNLPAQTGMGITGAFFVNFDAGNARDAELKSGIMKILEAVGSVIEVASEKMIDEMIAVTSSSPAYFCMMIEAMADYAVKVGFTRAQGLEMAERAMLGTAGFLLEKGKHPAVLRDEVCSPGGTTIAAVDALEKAGFKKAVLEGMDAWCRAKAVKTEGYI